MAPSSRWKKKPASQASLGWPPLSRFLFLRGRSLGLLLRCASELHQRRRRESARYHQTLFPTARSPNFGRRFWTGGLHHRIRRPPRSHLHLRH